MMELKDILYRVSILEIDGSTLVPISAVHFDSRKTEPACLYIAIRGTRADGHDYIEEVIQNGAAAVICEEMPPIRHEGVTYIRVEDSGNALGHSASNFFNNPSAQLKLVGITGTNGKTTTASLLYHLFRKLGYKAGLLSTVENKINDRIIPATHTTPDAVALNGLLKEMADEGCEFCFMEVSSHSVVQQRIAGLKFTGAVFTNLTHDHLDFHGTFGEYLKAKKRFFDDLPGSAFALVNADDKNGMVMLQNTKARKTTYGLKNMADFKAKILENQFEGMLLQVDGKELWSRLVGHFNAYNMLAIYGTAVLLKENKEEILRKLSELGSVEGRFECLRSETGIVAIVDYAHTPDAVSNVLSTINTIRTHNEQLITVIGAGGDRDRTKRPKMAHIACKLSNKVILTSDNPRSEDPEEIISEMKTGIDPIDHKKCISIVNRHEAIAAAVAFARSGDIILVAGKGHEKYQEIHGLKSHFDDKEELMIALGIQSDHTGSKTS